MYVREWDIIDPVYSKVCVRPVYRVHCLYTSGSAVLKPDFQTIYIILSYAKLTTLL